MNAKKRGRPSQADRALVDAKAPSTVRVRRPTAPDELSDEQAAVWRAVVNDHPADWFGASTAPLLIQYCRHTVAARRVAELLDAATADTEAGAAQIVAVLDKVLAMQQRESAILSSLATKMRISQQATSNHRGNKTDTSFTKPWQDDGNS